MPNPSRTDRRPTGHGQAVSGLFLHGRRPHRGDERRDAAGGGWTPHRIGRYRIVREIATGGMGTVYEARQDHPTRTVALKVLRAERMSAAERRRFEYEAELLARLQHPGLATVLEVGTFRSPGGVRPYFAMELVDGVPLSEYVDRHDPDLRARVTLVAAVCDAVHHAHQRGVIHRDLKPSNILIDANGHSRVLDFGVARLIAASDRPPSMRTEIGQVLGTVQYMSPEQLSGDPDLIDTRTDVYAIGVILFELLAGQLPYDIERTSLAHAAHIVVEREAPPLSRIDRRLRGDLETIVGRALEKDRERRYESVASLAADLRRFLHDQPIAARPPTAFYQLRKLARRNRVAFAAVAALLFTLVTATIGSSVLAITATTAEQRSRRLAQSLLKTLLAAEPDPSGFRLSIDSVERIVESEDFGDPLVEAEVRVALARKLRHRTVLRPQDAIRHLRRALVLLDQGDATADASRLAAVTELGRTYLGTGLVDEARLVADEAVALHETIHGPDHWRLDFDEVLYSLVLSSITDPDEYERRRLELHQAAGPALDLPTIDVSLHVPGPLEPLFDEQFDGGSLDPAWTVEPDGLVAWIADTVGSALIVEDVVPEFENDGNGGQYVTLRFGRPLPPVGDFEVTGRIGWAAKSRLAIQHVLVVLVAERGGRLAEIGWVDHWIDWHGTAHAQIIDGSLMRGPLDVMPATGTAEIGMRRVGEQIVLLWDGRPVLVGESPEKATAVVLEFAHYPTVSVGRRSTFGTLRVDEIRVDAAP